MADPACTPSTHARRVTRVRHARARRHWAVMDAEGSHARVLVLTPHVVHEAWHRPFPILQLSSALGVRDG